MKHTNTYEDMMVSTQTLRLGLLKPNSISNRIRRIQCMIFGHSLSILDKINVEFCDRCSKTLDTGDNYGT